MKGGQGSRLGTEGFLNHRATKCLDVSRHQEKRREDRKRRKLEFAQRRGLWWARQDTEPGFAKRDLGAPAAYYSNEPGGNGRSLPRL